MTAASRPLVGVDLRALVGDRPTGIGLATRALLLALSRRGKARYVGLAHAPIGCADELEQSGVAIEVRRAPLGVLWQQTLLPLRLARGDVDLLWSPIHTLPRALGIRAVVTVHDLSALAEPTMHTLRHRLSVVPFLASSLAQARRIVAISHATSAELLRFFPASAGKITVVHNGVDECFRPGTPDEIASIRAELGAPDGYVLASATLEPRKNLGACFDAWERLAREDRRTPPLLLTGAGGWKNEPIARRLEELRPLGARHLGYLERSRLVRVFQGARAFVYPSLYEGFGLPPLEAMACGVPTIVSDRTSLPEVVGDAGVIVEGADPGKIAEALRAILREPGVASRLAQLGVERARLFSWESSAAAMERVFLDVLRAR